MERLHFLNVNKGDCIWIQHYSGRNTIVDICNGNSDTIELQEDAQPLSMLARPTFRKTLIGNYNQAEHPTNPMEYFQTMEMNEKIFRFILTHPDMDHLDGIEQLFRSYQIINFWDTQNSKKMDFSKAMGKYKESDWLFYQRIRNSERNPKVLRFLAGSEGKYLQEDGIFVLSPNEDLVSQANKVQDFNRLSYVLLVITNNGKKVILAGDSDEEAWDDIMLNYGYMLQDIDILIAPHHGRKSGGCSKYLTWLSPKMTLFGNAESENMDYSSWNNKRLKHITNNQAGNIMVDFSSYDKVRVCVTNLTFAKNYIYINNRSFIYYAENRYRFYLIDEF